MNRTRRRGSAADTLAALGLAIAAGVGIAVLAGGLAYLVSTVVIGGLRDRDARLPSAEDQLERVSVWVGETESALALLQPLAQEEGVWRREDERLGREIAGDDADVSFAVLWIFNYDADEPLVFDRAATPLVATGAGGAELAALDLPALLARRNDLRPDLETFLRAYDAYAPRVAIPPRSFRRVLVALRGARDAGVVGAAHTIEIAALDLSLQRRQVRRHRLENYLASPGDRAMLLRGAL